MRLGKGLAKNKNEGVLWLVFVEGWVTVRLRLVPGTHLFINSCRIELGGDKMYNTID